jgi:WhiB family redox-sensing transcriptional regulator
MLAGMSNVADHDRWMQHASCLGLDADLFFPGPGDDPAPAKAVCAGCIVRAQCLAAALARREPDGIWGGLTASERRGDARRRRVRTRSRTSARGGLRTAPASP